MTITLVRGPRAAPRAHAEILITMFIGLALALGFPARSEGGDALPVPGIPAAMAAPALSSPGPTEIEVTRAAAPEDGGAEIIRYDLRWRPLDGSWRVMEGITPVQVIAVPAGDARYAVQTRAVNLAGDGPWSAEATIAMGAAGLPAPMAAPGLRVLGPEQIEVTLAAAPDDGGAPITGYRLRYRAPDLGTAWSVLPDIDRAVPVVLSGLVADTAYLVETTAVTALGTNFGAAASARTAAADGTAHMATIADFSRDMTILDSDSARGNNNADVPLAGTSDAPDGATVETRILRADTGAELLGWQATASVAGGVWAGSRGVPRSAHWMRVEARVAGSTAPAAVTANRFGVGLVFLIEDQSNVMQGITPNLDEIPADQVETIGNAPGDFQFLWNGPDGTGFEDIQHIHDGNIHTSSLAAMAATFAKTMPGLKVMAGFLTRSGSPLPELLDDTDPGRDWATVAVPMAQSMKADGAKLGIIRVQHFQGFGDAVEMLRGVVFGLDATGTGPLPGMAPDGRLTGRTEIAGAFVDHVLPEIFPELLTGYTQHSSTISRPHDANWDANLPSVNPVFESSFVELHPELAQDKGYFPLFTREDADDENGLGVHYTKLDDRGFPMRFRYLAVEMMAMGDLLALPKPQFDHIHYDPAGAYIELWSDTGPVTTYHRKLGLTSNFPLDPTADPVVEGQAEVLGFLSEGRNVVRTEIVDATGAPASAGRVRIYPDPEAAFGPTASHTYLQAHSGVRVPDDRDPYDWGVARHVDHLPVISLPQVPNIPGLPVRPFPTLYAINDANDLSPSEYTFSVDANTAGISTATTWSGGDSGLTIALRFSASTALRISNEADNDRYWSAAMWSRRRLALDLGDFEYTSSDGFFDFGPDGFCDLVLKVNFAAGAQRIEVYMNGAPRDPDGVFFDNSSFTDTLRAGRDHVLLAAGEGSVASLRQWKSVSPGPDLPTEAPWIAVIADPGGAFAAPSGRFDILDDGVARTP